MRMGKVEERQRLTVVRKLWGQVSTGPRGVRAQSMERMSTPMSPPPESQSMPCPGGDSGLFAFSSDDAGFMTWDHNGHLLARNGVPWAVPRRPSLRRQGGEPTHEVQWEASGGADASLAGTGAHQEWPHGGQGG